MQRVPSAVCVMAFVLMVAAGCGGDSNRAARPTVTSQTTASSGTAESATAVPIIDKVVAAVRSGDPAELQALLAYQRIPCTTAPPNGSGGPPLCKGDEAEGTPVDAIFVASCEGNYVRRDELEAMNVLSNAARSDSDVYAAYEYVGKDESGSTTGYGPDARYFVLFKRPAPDPAVGSGTGYGIVLSADGVLGIHYGCGWTPGEFANYNKFGKAVIQPLRGGSG